LTFPQQVLADRVKEGHVVFSMQALEEIVNTALEQLAGKIGLAPAKERLRLQFGYACVRRVQHLLEDPAAVECVSGLGEYLDGVIDRAALEALAARASVLASNHPGSKSLDGVGHAAVSATYAVANALAGKAQQAAEYAAYAMVYGQSGYGAVADRESFEPEFRWQLDCLASLAREASP